MYKRRRYHLYFCTCSKIKALPGLVIKGEKSKYPNKTFVCKKLTISIKSGRTPKRIPKILHNTDVLKDDIRVKTQLTKGAGALINNMMRRANGIFIKFGSPPIPERTPFKADRPCDQECIMVSAIHGLIFKKVRAHIKLQGMKEKTVGSFFQE